MLFNHKKMSRLFKTICKNGGIISQSKKQLNFALFHTSTKTFQSEEPFILKSKFEDVPLSKDTFGDFMWSNANKYQTRTALVSFLHTELFLNLVQSLRGQKMLPFLILI